MHARTLGLTVVACSVSALAALGVGTHLVVADEPRVAPAGERWEYLVVAGGTSNLTPSGDTSLRKSSAGAFREAFPLEQNLDKLGAQGWELVGVSGNPNDPTYYLKRRR